MEHLLPKLSFKIPSITLEILGPINFIGIDNLFEIIFLIYSDILPAVGENLKDLRGCVCVCDDNSLLLRLLLFIIIYLFILYIIYVNKCYIYLHKCYIYLDKFYIYLHKFYIYLHN